MNKKTLEKLGKEQPMSLLALIENRKLDNPDTSIAIEIASELIPHHETESVFLVALKHDSPIVREAAVYALAQNPTSQNLERFRWIATNDPSEAVREAATDAVFFIEG